MLVLLEGNIAAGKTTLGEALTASDRFRFVPEPVAHWQTGFAANLLERFYADTPRWAFTMQIGAFVTRAGLVKPTTDGCITVYERSVYCDRYVFARNLHDQGLMDDTEWAVYCHFWAHFTAALAAPTQRRPGPTSSGLARRMPAATAPLATGAAKLVPETA